MSLSWKLPYSIQQSAKTLIGALERLYKLVEVFNDIGNIYGTRVDYIQSYLFSLAVANDIGSSFAVNSHPSNTSATDESNAEDEYEDIGDDGELMVNISNMNDFSIHHRWAKTTRQYLRLVVLHWRSLLSLVYPAEIGQHFKHYLSTLEVNVIDLRTKQPDNRMTKVMECMLNQPRALAAVHDGVDARGVLTKALDFYGIAEEFKRADRADAFQGTFHCETILLSLHLFGRECQKDN